jgi:positive regulator of sigma E activity
VDNRTHSRTYNRKHNRHRCVVRDGVVQASAGDRVTVRISRNPACIGCRAQSVCSGAHTKDTEVDAVCGFSAQAGDAVRLEMTEKLGLLAVLLGFAVPLILLVSAFFFLENSFGNEVLSGTLSLTTLAPYYLGLSLFRNRLSRQFVLIATKPTQ